MSPTGWLLSSASIQYTEQGFRLWSGAVSPVLACSGVGVCLRVWHKYSWTLVLVCICRWGSACERLVISLSILHGRCHIWGSHTRREDEDFPRTHLAHNDDTWHALGVATTRPNTEPAATYPFAACVREGMCERGAWWNIFVCASRVRNSVGFASSFGIMIRRCGCAHVNVSMYGNHISVDIIWFEGGGSNKQGETCVFHIVPAGSLPSPAKDS